MMSSKLPTASLGKIWDLSDIDRDGLLDRYEFTVAMHLVFRALQVISKFNLPNTHLKCTRTISRKLNYINMQMYCKL